MTRVKSDRFDVELHELWQEGLSEIQADRILSELSAINSQSASQDLKREIKKFEERATHFAFSSFLRLVAIPVALAVLTLSILPSGVSVKNAHNPVALNSGTFDIEFNSEDYFIQDEFELFDEDLQLLEEIL